MTLRLKADQGLVAAKDGKPGCPEPRWDLYRYRCGMGIDECHLHGPFETKPAEHLAEGVFA